MEQQQGYWRLIIANSLNSFSISSARWRYGQALPHTAAGRGRLFYRPKDHIPHAAGAGRALLEGFGRAVREPLQTVRTGKAQTQCYSFIFLSSVSCKEYAVLLPMWDASRVCFFFSFLFSMWNRFFLGRFLLSVEHFYYFAQVTFVPYGLCVCDALVVSCVSFVVTVLLWTLLSVSQTSWFNVALFLTCTLGR